MLTVGLGLPTHYWLVLRHIQVLENKEEVVVLADVYRARRHFGIAPSGSVGNPVVALKIVVKSDGTVQATRYGTRGIIGFSPGLFTVASVNDDLCLFDITKYSGQRLLKLGSGPDFEPATEAEREALTRLIQVQSLDEDGLSSRLDESLKKSGWRRLDSTDGWLDDIESADNRLMLREERTDAAIMIVAESTSTDRPWRKILLKVDRRAWWSYMDPYSRPPAPAP